MNAMKMPDGASALVAGLDMVVKPLSRFGKRRDLMGYALPGTNHRDNQENEGREAEQLATDGATRDPVDPSEQS